MWNQEAAGTRWWKHCFPWSVSKEPNPQMWALSWPYKVVGYIYPGAFSPLSLAHWAEESFFPPVRKTSSGRAGVAHTVDLCCSTKWSQVTQVSVYWLAEVLKSLLSTPPPPFSLAYSVFYYSFYLRSYFFRWSTLVSASLSVNVLYK